MTELVFSFNDFNFCIRFAKASPETCVTVGSGPLATQHFPYFVHPVHFKLHFNSLRTRKSFKSKAQRDNNFCGDGAATLEQQRGGGYWNGRGDIRGAEYGIHPVQGGKRTRGRMLEYRRDLLAGNKRRSDERGTIWTGFTGQVDASAPCVEAKRSRRGPGWRDPRCSSQPPEESDLPAAQKERSSLCGFIGRWLRSAGWVRATSYSIKYSSVMAKP